MVTTWLYGFHESCIPKNMEPASLFWEQWPRELRILFGRFGHHQTQFLLLYESLFHPKFPKTKRPRNWLTLRSNWLLWWGDDFCVTRLIFLLPRGNNIRDTPSLSPPIIIINTDTSAGIRLVQLDHVTRIMSSGWSTSHQGSTVWEISMLAKIPAFCILHILGFMGLIYAGATYPL